MLRIKDWDRAWRTLLLCLLPVAALVAAADSTVPPRERVVTAALSVAVAVWHWWMVMAHPDWPERARVPMVLYFAVLVVLAGMLFARHPAYGLLVLACFPTAFATLPGWYAYLGVAATAVVIVGGPTALADADSPWLLASALTGSVLAAFIGWSIRALEAEIGRRHAVNRALESANARLAQLGEENAELQGKLLDAARQTGITGERSRLAREIHDTVAQGLAGIVTQLEAAEEAANDAESVRRRLAVARALARESLAEARRSLDDLRPGPLTGTRLPEALSELVAGWSSANESNATLTVTGTARLLHPEVEVAVYRVVQEALANVARHASAGKTGVTLSYMEDVLVADIRDDGVGFPVTETTGRGAGVATSGGASTSTGMDAGAGVNAGTGAGVNVGASASASASAGMSAGMSAGTDMDPGAGMSAGRSGSGFGLIAMRQRVVRLAGTVEVESAPGHGTAISVTIPAIPATPAAVEREAR